MSSCEDLNCIVVWLLLLREKFEDHGIVCVREIYDECVGKQESELNKAPVVPMIQKVPISRWMMIPLMKLNQMSRIFYCHPNLR